jgi:hypothetical protein
MYPCLLLSRGLLISRSCTLLLLVGLVLLSIALYNIKWTTGSTTAFVRLGFGSVHAEAQGRMGLWNGVLELCMLWLILTVE